MKKLLLLLAIWPFSHHRRLAPTPLAEIFPDEVCDKGAEGWWYFGPDGVGGYSTESCQDAVHDWKKIPSPKRTMNQI